MKAISTSEKKKKGDGRGGGYGWVVGEGGDFYPSLHLSVKRDICKNNTKRDYSNFTAIKRPISTE